MARRLTLARRDQRGHELDEAAELVSRHPKELSEPTKQRELSAGVMRDGASDAMVTAHDVAAAREVVALYKDHQLLTRKGSPNATARGETLDRAIRAQGLDEATAIHKKLALLKDAGAPPELIERVRNVEADRVLGEHKKAHAGTSVFDRDLIRHMLFADKSRGDFERSGISGGHDDRELKRYVQAPDTRADVRHVSTRKVGGLTCRSYEQYEWKGPGPKPRPGSPESPSGGRFDRSKWRPAEPKKTTFDDVEAFLREAEVAWGKWFHSNRHVTQGDTEIRIRSDSGLEFVGHLTSKDPPFRIKSLYVELK